MNDKPHIRLVDTHTEGVGCNHHLPAVVNKIVLIFHSFLGRQAGVIARRGNAAAVQHIADFLHLFARGAIDDSRFALALLQQLQQLGWLAFRMDNGKEKIRAVKPCRDYNRVLQLQKAYNILAHFACRGSGKRADNRTVRQVFDKAAYIQIAFAEILTPLRHAMRLVHGNHGYICSLRK